MPWRAPRHTGSFGPLEHDYAGAASSSQLWDRGVMPGSTQGTWAGIIDAVKTPIGLFALVVLVIEAVLAALAVKAEGWDFTILVVGLIATLAAVVVIVGLALRRDPGLGASREPSPPPTPTRPPVPEIRYDAFIAAPMAGFTDDASAAYQRSRADVLRLIRVLKEHTRARTVFYAGEKLPSLKSFETADLSLEQDLQALRSSDCLIFIYPARIVTSALVEVGVAIGLKKPIFIHVLDGVELPFLLKQEEGPASTHGPIHIYRYANFSDILQIYRANPDILRRDQLRTST